MNNTSYEAGVWGFTWEEALESRNAVQGIANLTDAGVRLEIPYGRLLDESGVVKIGIAELPKEANYIYGCLRTGHYAVLKKAISAGSSESFPGGVRQTIAAEYMFTSKDRFNPESKVSSIEVQLFGLRDWVGKTPFISVRDAKTYKFKSTVFDREHIEEYNLALFDNSEMEVSLNHVATISGVTVKGQTIDHDCHAIVAFKSNVTLDKSLEAVFTLSKFLSFCTGGFAEVLEIKIIFEDSASPVNCHAHSVKATNKPETLEYVRFPLSTLEPDIATILGKWLYAPEELREPFNLLVSLEMNNLGIPLDMRFIMAAQILEAFSRVNVDLASMPKELYEKFKTVLLDSVVDPEVKEWIQGRLPGNEKGQARLLKELFEANTPFATWLIEDQKKFKENHVITRNRYTHRRETGKALDGEALYWHTEAVKLLCIGIACKHIGIPHKTVISRFSTPGSKSYAIGKVKAMYMKERSI